MKTTPRTVDCPIHQSEVGPLVAYHARVIDSLVSAGGRTIDIEILRPHVERMAEIIAAADAQ
jgi:hypothetical protein